MNFNLNTVNSEVGKIRKQITDLKEENVWINESFPPLEDCINNACNLIDDKASQSRVISKLMSEEDPFRTGFDRAGFIQLGPLLCDLFGDELKQKLAEKIKSSNYEHGPKLSERQSIVAENNNTLQSLEEQEEEIISHAEKLGMSVNRRSDVDVKTLLNWTD